MVSPVKIFHQWRHTKKNLDKAVETILEKAEYSESGLAYALDERNRAELNEDEWSEEAPSGTSTFSKVCFFLIYFHVDHWKLL